jgi:hypothetical protein
MQPGCSGRPRMSQPARHTDPENTPDIPADYAFTMIASLTLLTISYEAARQPFAVPVPGLSGYLVIRCCLCAGAGACPADPVALIAARSRGAVPGVTGSRSNAAGALEAGCRPAEMIGRPGHGVPGLPVPGAGGGGRGRRAGAAWRGWPSLPLSYARVGIAGLWPARWCP